MATDSAFLYAGPKSGRVSVHQYESVDPTPTDDFSKGFIVTSRWINIASLEEFVCLDATPGAAVWKNTTSGGGGGGITYGGPSSLVVGGGNVPGASTSVTRADHIHALPPFGTTAGTFCEGNDSRLGGAPANHAASHLPGGTDALATAAAGAIQPDDAAAVGVAASFARSDHKHSIVAAVAGATAAGDTAAEGVATSFSRSDHRHSVATAAAGATAAGDTAADGVAATFARSDHRHSVATAAAGAATPGDTAADGVAVSFSRSDHRHSLPAFGVGAGTFCQGNDARLSDDRVASGLRSASTVVSVSAAAAPTVGQILTAVNGTTATWQTPSSGNSLSQYLADIAPSSPHSDNDEFNDNSIAGAWATWDFAAIATFAENANGLEITATGNGAVRWCGKYKAVPASEFAIIIKVGLHGQIASGGAEAGIVVLQDATSAAGDLRGIGIDIDLNATSVAVTSRTFTAYNGSASAITSSAAVYPPYLRVRCNGTAMETDHSHDGLSWKRHSTVTLAFTPTHVGLGLLAVGVSAVTGRFRFYRVWSGAGSSGFDASSIGAWKNILYQ